jgi:hypothetical protein
LNFEARLHQLESNYRTGLSATVVEKANYLALAGDLRGMPSDLIHNRRARVVGVCDCNPLLAHWRKHTLSRSR